MVVSNFVIGDPEWIGGLQHPEYAHGPDNRFVYRYAYLALPAGQTLDLNAIHNCASPSSIPTGSKVPWPDYFLRNQGVLTAEINLAAFLDDLNTNLWPSHNQLQSQYGFARYSYNPGAASTGAAADDAASVMRYRYGTNVNSLGNVSLLLRAPGSNAFSTGFIDVYSEGPLMNGTWWPPPGFANPNPTRVKGNYPWAGADNPNHFYTPQDLFDRDKLALPSGSPKQSPYYIP